MVPLHASFITLLVCLLALSTLDVASAAPVVARSPEPFKKARVGIVVRPGATNPAKNGSKLDGVQERSSFGEDDAEKQQLFTLPLKRLEGRSGDPGVVLQTHINRATVKLAQIKRRAAPSAEALRSALQRRQTDQLARRSLATEDSVFQPLAKREPAHFAPNRGRIGVVLKAYGSEMRARVVTGARNLLMGSNSTLASDSPATPASYKALAKTPSFPAAAATKKSSANSLVKPVKAIVSGFDGFPKAAIIAASSAGLQKAKAATAQNSLGLDIEANDVGYVATVAIGSNRTPFRLLIDSGSADTWVASTACTGCSSVHRRLGKSVSKTFVGSKKPFSITYGTGSVSGILATDDLYVAGLTLKGHTIGLAREESNDFNDPSVPFDGLMGLAQQKLANSRSPTPIDAMFQKQLVKQPVMGYRLARAADNSNDGEVTFGGVDASKYKGALTEVANVSKQGFWEINLDGVSFDGKPIAALNGGRTAILDTGTTLIVAPEADALAIHLAIPGAKTDGAGGYTIPCTTAAGVSFSFGGKMWPMTPNDMKFLPVDNNDLKGDCISSISGGDVGQANEWLVGAAFLRNIYLATNTRTNTIGLGTLV